MFELIIEKIVSTILFLGPAMLLLGFLIFVHELGHFLAARFVGIRVEVFSIGFGKRLLGFRKGATDYRISMIPFGGYVRMAGEELPGQNEGAEDQESTENLSDKYRQPGDTLNEKPVPHRLLVAFAGAGMNAVVAVLLTIGLAYFGLNIDAYLVEAPVIAYVQSQSAAQEAGLQAGDTIQTIEGKSVKTWEDAQQALLLNIDKPISLDVMRDDQLISTELLIEKSQAMLFGGIGSPSMVMVGAVNPDSPAREAGLEAGDQISEINGVKLASIYQLQDLISQSKDQPVQLTVKRNDSVQQMILTPSFNEEYERYMIGISFAADPNKVLRRYPFKESVIKGVDLNIQMSRLMLTIFQRLLVGKESMKNLGGPLMIVDMAGKAAKSGVRDLIWLTALISLNLAILNLLPIPVFDGGLIVFLLIEWVIRRPVNEKIQIALQNLFFFLLIFFALYISFIDFTRIDWLSWFK